jgi:hypothetical protein
MNIIKLSTVFLRLDSIMSSIFLLGYFIYFYNKKTLILPGKCISSFLCQCVSGSRPQNLQNVRKSYMQLDKNIFAFPLGQQI